MNYFESCITGKVYHVFNKSIAKYVIFNRDEEFKRMLDMLYYYRIKDQPLSFSKFRKQSYVQTNGIRHSIDELKGSHQVAILAYCLMATHFHLILMQLDDYGISNFIRKVALSYTRYFNLRHKRKGPLWQSRFGRRDVLDDEDFWNLTRYVHYNPVNDKYVNRCEDWPYSSIKEYAKIDNNIQEICSIHDYYEVPSDIIKFSNQP